MRMSYTPFQTTNATANQRISRRGWTRRLGGGAIAQYQGRDVIALRRPLREDAHVGEDRLEHVRRRCARTAVRRGNDARFAVFLTVRGHGFRHAIADDEKDVPRR